MGVLRRGEWSKSFSWDPGLSLCFTVPFFGSSSLNYQKILFSNLFKKKGSDLSPHLFLKNCNKSTSPIFSNNGSFQVKNDHYDIQTFCGALATEKLEIYEHFLKRWSFLKLFCGSSRVYIKIFSKCIKHLSKLTKENYKKWLPTSGTLFEILTKFKDTKM